MDVAMRQVTTLEVNRNLPWANGLNSCEINVRDVNHVVEWDNLPVAQLGETEKMGTGGGAIASRAECCRIKQGSVAE